MKSKIISIAALLVFCSVFSCRYDLKCEKHFIEMGYIGKVVIYFYKKDGQKQFDKEGCRVYNISEKGEYFSSLSFNEGWGKVHTIRYFEKIITDSLNEIFDFEKEEYLIDSVHNKLKKYIFAHSGGFKSPDYIQEYYVDYGMNYKKYVLN